jgi:hypothetical protein
MKGYFVKGAYFEGIHPSMIGKKIIHVGRCKCPYGYDGSFCTVSGTGVEQDPRTHYVILRGIQEDNSLCIEWNPRNYPGELMKLEPWWNDGEWIEVHP